MSRGFGAVQRFVLDVLARPHEPSPFGCWLTVDEAARELAQGRPSRAQVEAVRRAMKQLSAAGRIELRVLDVETTVRAARVDRGEFYVYRPRHETHRPMLAAHWPLSVEEEEAIAQFEQWWAELLRRWSA